MNIIECMDVKSAYDKRKLSSSPVIDRINLGIEEGRAVAILGSNGSGKSTLLRTMCGMIPYQGSVLLDGKDIRLMKRKEIAKKVSLLSQVSSIYFSYTVYETILMGRYPHLDRIFGGYDEDDKNAALEALERTDTVDMKDRNLSELSGGELQRVFLARCFAQKTPVILLDEPMNHLDLKVQAHLSEYLDEWRSEKGHTLIGVYHDISLALRLCDEVIYMKNGELIDKGSKEDLVSRDMLVKVFDFDVYGYLGGRL